MRDVFREKGTDVCNLLYFVMHQKKKKERVDGWSRYVIKRVEENVSSRTSVLDIAEGWSLYNSFNLVVCLTSFKRKCWGVGRSC